MAPSRRYWCPTTYTFHTARQQRWGLRHANPFQPETPHSNNPFRQNFVPPLIYPLGTRLHQCRRILPSPPFGAAVAQAEAAPAPAPPPVPAAVLLSSLAAVSLRDKQDNQAKHQRVLDLLEMERKWLKIPGEIRAEQLLRSDVMLRGTYLRYADDEERRKAWLKSQLSATAYGNTADLYDGQA